MKNIIKSIKTWALSHKKSAIGGLFVLVACIYLFAGIGNEEGEARHVLATAERGSVSIIVTGSGQVEAFEQDDISSAVSGDVEYVGVKEGEAVKKGTVIARIGSESATKSVSNAELSVSNAEIAYKNAQKKYADQEESSLVSDIKKSYEDGYSAISSAFIDLPAIFLKVGDIFYDPEHSPYFSDSEIRLYANSSAVDYKYEAGRIFDSIKDEYDGEFSTYRTLSVTSPQADIESFLETMYSILKGLATALNATYSTIDYVNIMLADSMSDTQMPPEVAADKTQISSYLSKVNNHISAISDAITEIEDSKDSLAEAEISLRSAELSLSQARDTLREAKETLGDHTISAEFDGVVAEVSVKVGDKVSPGTDIAAVITDQKVVTISLNEVDAANVKVGQKATLTFDAVDGLIATGEVIEVDILGTVTQGVVSYSMKIAFDAGDDRIKSGMTTSAAIAVDSKDGVITVSSGAIKARGNMSYVEVLGEDGAVRMAPVETGLSSEDTTEILTGLSEGDAYIVRTITLSTDTATQAGAAASLFGGTGTRGMPSQTGTVRIQGMTGGAQMLQTR